MTALRLSAAVLAGILTSGLVSAQEARLSPSSSRTLFAVTDSVKGDDGARIAATTTLVYEPSAGRYVHTVTDGDGRVLTRAVRSTSVVGPTPAEMRASREAIASHPEIAALIEDARGEVTIDGGFPLVREQGHACGPGGRCVTLDVWQTLEDGDRQRIRYVVVDLREIRVLEADADPQADSNLAHPAARQQSRFQ